MLSAQKHQPHFTLPGSIFYTFNLHLLAFYTDAQSSPPSKNQTSTSASSSGLGRRGEGNSKTSRDLTEQGTVSQSLSKESRAGPSKTPQISQNRSNEEAGQGPELKCISQAAEVIPQQHSPTCFSFPASPHGLSPGRSGSGSELPPSTGSPAPGRQEGCRAQCCPQHPSSVSRA